jgi:hypothetical protein
MDLLALEQHHKIEKEKEKKKRFGVLDSDFSLCSIFLN